MEEKYKNMQICNNRINITYAQRNEFPVYYLYDILAKHKLQFQVDR